MPSTQTHLHTSYFIFSITYGGSNIVILWGVLVYITVYVSIDKYVVIPKYGIRDEKFNCSLVGCLRNKWTEVSISSNNAIIAIYRYKYNKSEQLSYMHYTQIFVLTSLFHTGCNLVCIWKWVQYWKSAYMFLTDIVWLCNRLSHYVTGIWLHNRIMVTGTSQLLCV